MNRRAIFAAAISIVTALGCARLGLWQLDRHAERRALNERVAERRAAPPVQFAALQDDSTARYRQVEVRGVLDYSHELVLANRTRNGAPGVHLLTPLRSDDGGVVLVNRGWVYSPDATHVERDSWRDADTVRITGYMEAFEQGGDGLRGQLAPGVWQRLDRDALRRALPFDIGAHYLVALTVTPERETPPARLGVPAMGQGSHLSYAFQWFAFGTIALIGGGVLIVQERRRRR